MINYCLYLGDYMIQKSKQHKKTGEIIILSSTKNPYWFGEKHDYSIKEIELNKEQWKSLRTKRKH